MKPGRTDVIHLYFYYATGIALVYVSTLIFGPDNCKTTLYIAGVCVCVLLHEIINKKPKCNGPKCLKMSPPSSDGWRCFCLEK